MKRSPILVCILIALWAGTAGAVSVGAGVFGGASFPIVQDDTGSGPQFGLRAPVNLIPFLTVEPYFVKSSLGAADGTFGGFKYERDGFDVTVAGVNVALGGVGMLSGLPFYPYVGIASHSLTRDGSADRTEVGYNFGLGLGFGVAGNLSINARGEFNMIVTEDTSRKFANATLGVTYRLWTR